MVRRPIPGWKSPRPPIEGSKAVEKVLLKGRALWRERPVEPYQFFCPLCRAERRLPRSPDPWKPRYLIQVGLCSVVFALVTSPWFSWKGIVAFVPFWAAFEASFRILTRQKLRCDQCGFDPILYLSDLQKAREEVEGHWRKVFAEKGIPYPEKKKDTAQPGATAQDGRSSGAPRLTGSPGEG